jgi:hypothetical protein
MIQVLVSGRDLHSEEYSVTDCYESLAVLLVCHTHVHMLKHVGYQIMIAAVCFLKGSCTKDKLQACFMLMAILRVTTASEACGSYRDVFGECGGMDALADILQICMDGLGNRIEGEEAASRARKCVQGGGINTQTQTTQGQTQTPTQT